MLLRVAKDCVATVLFIYLFRETINYAVEVTKRKARSVDRYLVKRNLGAL